MYLRYAKENLYPTKEIQRNRLIRTSIYKHTNLTGRILGRTSLLPYTYRKPNSQRVVVNDSAHFTYLLSCANKKNIKLI